MGLTVFSISHITFSLADWRYIIVAMRMGDSIDLLITCIGHEGGKGTKHNITCIYQFSVIKKKEQEEAENIFR